MTKLINAYLAASTKANAAKIVEFAAKNPYALDRLPADEAAMVAALCRIAR